MTTKQKEEAKLTPFTKEDWDGLAGCESEEPLIAYLGDEDCLVVDDESLTWHHEDGRTVAFESYKNVMSSIEAQTVAEALIRVWNEFGKGVFTTLVCAVLGDPEEC